MQPAVDAPRFLQWLPDRIVLEPNRFERRSQTNFNQKDTQ